MHIKEATKMKRSSIFFFTTLTRELASAFVATVAVSGTLHSATVSGCTSGAAAAAQEHAVAGVL